MRGILTPFFVVVAATLYAMSATVDLSATLICAALAGFMVMGAQFSLYGQAPGLYPAHVRVVGAGAAIGVGRAGAIIGPLIAGELRQAGFSGGQVFIAMIPMVIVAAVATLALSYVGKPHDE